VIHGKALLLAVHLHQLPEVTLIVPDPPALP
jgi:hypothetical protein